jgi:hypothetical protein
MGKDILRLGLHAPYQMTQPEEELCFSLLHGGGGEDPGDQGPAWLMADNPYIRAPPISFLCNTDTRYGLGQDALVDSLLKATQEFSDLRGVQSVAVWVLRETGDLLCEGIGWVRDLALTDKYAESINPVVDLALHPETLYPQGWELCSCSCVYAPRLCKHMFEDDWQVNTPQAVQVATSLRLDPDSPLRDMSAESLARVTEQSELLPLSSGITTQAKAGMCTPESFRLFAPDCLRDSRGIVCGTVLAVVQPNLQEITSPVSYTYTASCNTLLTPNTFGPGFEETVEEATGYAGGTWAEQLHKLVGPRQESPDSPPVFLPLVQPLSANAGFTQL